MKDQEKLDAMYFMVPVNMIYDWQNGDSIKQLIYDIEHCQTGSKHGTDAIEKRQFEEGRKWQASQSTPEFQWPTAGAIRAGYKNWYDARTETGAPSYLEVFRGAIQWLQTSAGTREGDKSNETFDAFPHITPIVVENKQLKEALQEACNVMTDLKEQIRYVTWDYNETHFENTKDWEILCNIITKAKSLLNQ